MNRYKIDGRLRCTHCFKVIKESKLTWLYGKPYHLNPGCTLTSKPKDQKR